MPENQLTCPRCASADNSTVKTENMFDTRKEMGSSAVKQVPIGQRVTYKCQKCGQQWSVEFLSNN